MKAAFSLCRLCSWRNVFLTATIDFLECNPMIAQVPVLRGQDHTGTSRYLLASKGLVMSEVIYPSTISFRLPFPGLR